MSAIEQLWSGNGNSADAEKIAMVSDELLNSAVHICLECGSRFEARDPESPCPNCAGQIEGQ